MLKNINLLLNRGLNFLWNGLIGNVVSTLPNVVKIDVEIHNVVSTLLNVVNFNVDVHNVVSTLIWRCATSRRHINLKATLNRRWNVCWDVWFDTTYVCVVFCLPDLRACALFYKIKTNASRLYKIYTNLVFCIIFVYIFYSFCANFLVRYITHQHRVLLLIMKSKPQDPSPAYYHLYTKKLKTFIEVGSTLFVLCHIY